MGRASWKMVIQQVDRLCAEGTSSGWADDQLLARFATAREESALAFEAIERRAAERMPVATMEDRPSAFESDDYRILHEEVARLPEKYRAAVVLCYFEGLTHDQAAASLRWPVGTVRGYLARARALLRTRLIRRGLAPAVAAGVLTHPSPSSATALAPGLVDAVTSAVSKGAITETVAALARSMARGLLVASIRRSMLCALVVALGLSGLGLTAAYLRTSAPPAGPPRPGGSTPASGPAEPLPEGVADRIGTTRFNHGSRVSFVVFSPDGSIMASFGYDDLIRLWDPSTGREIRQIGQPADYLDCPVFSPDGRTLAVLRPFGGDATNANRRRVFVIGFDVRRERASHDVATVVDDAMDVLVPLIVAVEDEFEMIFRAVEVGRYVSIPRELPLILADRPIMAIGPLTDAGSQPLR
jgi:hypothetical protein